MSIRRALIQITIIYSALVGVGALAVLAVLKRRTALSAWAVRILLILAFAPLLCLASTPEAIAAVATCRVANITQGTPGGSNLQAAINAARRATRSRWRASARQLRGRHRPHHRRHAAQGHAKPVLQGESPNRVLRVDASVTLTNLTIVGGEAAYRGGRWDGAGGGIYVTEGGSLVLNDAVVRGNRAWMEGGGISNLGELVLNGSSSVIGNTVRFDGHGGGIANYGTMILNDSSSVRGNRADEGGGLLNYGSLTMNDSSSIRANRARIGGGISLEDPKPLQGEVPTLTLNDESSVRGNEGEEAGGGLSIGDGTTITMNDSSSVSGNLTAQSGGGIWSVGGTVVLQHTSSVSGNRAGDTGGGIYLLTGPGLTMRGSSSVSGNSAKAGGGIATGGPPITMNGSSSVTGNTAVDAGGILANGPLMLDGSSSVRGNHADRDSDIARLETNASHRLAIPAGVAVLLLVAIGAAAVIVWRRTVIPAQPSPPTYLGAAAVLMVMLGLVSFVVLPYLGPLSWAARAPGAVMVAGGVGLVFGQRWAWPFMLVTAIPMLGLAVVFALASGTTYPEHPGAPGAFALVGVLFLTMGCLLVVASMTPAAPGLAGCEGRRSFSPVGGVSKWS